MLSIKGGVAMPTIKLESQLVLVDNATPIDRVAMGNTSDGSAQARGEYVRPKIRMKRKAMATQAQPTAVWADQSLAYRPERMATLMIYAPAVAKPPKIANGRRPTLSMIKKQTTTVTSCRTLNTPDKVNDISSVCPMDWKSGGSSR
jgi:hypothetical protein